MTVKEFKEMVARIPSEYDDWPLYVHNEAGDYLDSPLPVADFQDGEDYIILS